MLSLDWKAAELVDLGPAASVVLIGFRMACAGRAMAPFETLVEAAAAYRLEPDKILGPF
jgi:hypothetical protein